MGEFRSTFCRLCEPMCPLTAELGEDGSIASLRPNRDHPVSRGYACHKGLSFLDVHNDPDRPLAPLRRLSAKREHAKAEFEQVGWDEAMDDVGSRLRAIVERHGPHALAVYIGNPAAFSSASLPRFAGLAARAGSRNAFNAGTQDASNKFAAASAIYGSHEIMLPDLAHTDYFLCLGANPKISHWTFVSTPRPLEGCRNIVARGGKVLFVNPRAIESASPATGELLQVKPDTDVYLLAAILYELSETGRFDIDATQAWGRDIDGLKGFLADYSPERVAPVVGVTSEEIRTIAHEFAMAPTAAAYLSTGVNQGRNGTLAYWLLTMLSFVTGNLGRKGGNYFAEGFHPFPNPAPTPEKSTIETPLGPMRVVYGALPANLLPEFIESEREPIRALIVVGGNPLLSIGGEQRMRRAFAKLELLVSIDLFRNATAEYADYILPTPDWLERADINLLSNNLQPEPYVQYADAVVAPRYDRRAEWWIAAKLEQALGIPSALDHDPPSPFAKLDAMLAASDLSIETLQGLPHGTAVLPQPDRGNFYEKVLMTPDHRLNCRPIQFEPLIRRCAEIFAELEREPAHQLKLIGLRTNYMLNSNLANMKSLKRARHAENRLHISPADAVRLGLAEGDIVDVTSAHGELTVPIEFDESLRPSVVALSHGYGHRLSHGLTTAHAAPGVNANALMPTGHGTFDPVSNMSQLTGVAVELRRRAATSAMRETEAS